MCLPIILDFLALIISEGESSDNFSSINWKMVHILRLNLIKTKTESLNYLNSPFSSVPYSLFTQNIPSYYLNQPEVLKILLRLFPQYFVVKIMHACNYNSEATTGPTTLVYADEGCYYCNGDCKTQTMTVFAI